MALNLKRKREKEAAQTAEKRHQITPDEAEKNINEGSHISEEGSEEEEEEWGGIADEKNLQAELETKSKKPLTGEELRTIRDAGDLFRSNSFKLQMDALLPNIRPKRSRIPPLERALFSLHEFIMALPQIPPQHPLEASRELLKKKNVAVPYPHPLPTEDTNWKVAFEKPNEITVVGSWANKLGVKAKDGEKFGVDLAVEMPESLFQEKDYLNCRYFHKRSFYLAVIAASITSPKSGQKYDVSYESLSGDSRLTVLVLQPRKDGSENDFSKLNAQIRMIPSLSSSSPIPLHRLSPKHSNLRLSTESHPTPTYNTAILTSFTPKSQLLAVHALKESVPAFTDALALLRVWANQRGYGGVRMCVRGFEGKGPWWTAVLGLLVNGEESSQQAGKRRSIGKGLSSYQLFRAALDFLSRRDFQTQPVYLKSKDGHRFSTEEYSSHHEAVFVDASSTVNLLADVPQGSLDMLKIDAKQTLEVLDRSEDPFTEVFLKDLRNLPTRFDALLRVDLSFAKCRNSDAHFTLDKGSPSNALLSSLASLLRHGLSDRTKAVTILHLTPSTRPLTQAHPSHPSVIHIGLIYEPENAFRLVTHGPAADESDPDAVPRFRDFWGDKAELRRFKDGRIVESVVWDVKTTDERSHIPALIARHILNRHFDVSDAHISHTSFDSVLKLPESISQVYQDIGTPVGFKGALAAFDNFVKKLKALDDELPLSILNVSPTSQYLRYTSVFAPLPHVSSPQSRPNYFPSMDIVFQFEKSARWPDDLRAIQKIKLAFFERIASVYMAATPGATANVVIGAGANFSDVEDHVYLEIITTEGWAFRGRIWHDREETLLRRVIGFALNHRRVPGQEEPSAKERQDATDALEVYTRRFIHSPRHHHAIAALCHRFGAFAGTVRLVQRWLASHWLLRAHVSPEAIEIICASVFLGHESPGSKERGFAAVLRFLKEWKWEDGLDVKLYGAETPEVPAESVGSPSRQGMWKLLTEVDPSGHMWTAHGPDLVAARRVHALATATWDCLQEIEHGSLDVKALFTHPTEDYDFLIELDCSTLPRYYQNIHADLAAWKGKYVNLRAGSEDSPVRPGFDPASLLFADLQRTYNDTFKLFWDPFGGDRFGAVWDPSLKSPRPFRVLGGFSSIPVRTDGKDKVVVTLNEAGVLKEIERLGSGLVMNVTTRM